MRSAPIVEVAMKTKNAAHPATEKKFRLLMRQIPWSSSGGLSCLGFFGTVPEDCFVGAGAAVCWMGGEDGGVTTGFEASPGGGEKDDAPSIFELVEFSINEQSW